MNIPGIHVAKSRKFGDLSSSLRHFSTHLHIWIYELIESCHRVLLSAFTQIKLIQNEKIVVVFAFAYEPICCMEINVLFAPAVVSKRSTLEAWLFQLVHN